MRAETCYSQSYTRVRRSKCVFGQFSMLYVQSTRILPLSETITDGGTLYKYAAKNRQQFRSQRSTSNVCYITVLSLKAAFFCWLLYLYGK